MVVTTYDELSCEFAKVVYSAYRNQSIPLSTLDLAKSQGEITADDYTFIKG